MKLRGVMLFALVSIVFAVFTWQLAHVEAYPVGDPRLGKPVVDIAVIRQARKIRITNERRSVTLFLDAERKWCVKELYGYKVSRSRLTRFISGLSETMVERLAAVDPSGIGRLGFADTRIELFDVNGQSIWNLGLGKEGREGGRYIRFGPEQKAYFANMNLWLDVEPVGWADRRLVEIKPDTVDRLEMQLADGTLIAVRGEKGEWTVRGAAGRLQVDASMVDLVLTILCQLRFAEVYEGYGSAIAVKEGIDRTYRLVNTDGVAVQYDFGKKPNAKDSELASVRITSTDEKVLVNGSSKERLFQVPGVVLEYLPQSISEVLATDSMDEKKRRVQKIFSLPPPLEPQ